MTRPAGNVLKLPFCKLWHSLEVTFLYEHFLLELRHLAFEGKSHLGRVYSMLQLIRAQNLKSVLTWAPV